MGVAFILHCDKATSPLRIPEKVNSSINNNVLSILPIRYITSSPMEPHAQHPAFGGVPKKRPPRDENPVPENLFTDG